MSRAIEKDCDVVKMLSIEDESPGQPIGPIILSDMEYLPRALQIGNMDNARVKESGKARDVRNVRQKYIQDCSY
jgi:hypothetical protein